MSQHSTGNLVPDLESAPVPFTAWRVSPAGGANFELLCVEPESSCHSVHYWMPALGVPARHYLPFAMALAALGIAVVLHEWRGIGSSAIRASRRNDWAYRDLLQVDLPAGMAAVRERWPDMPCTLGGHSLGGQMAALYASLHPRELSGLVLVASGSPYWRQFRHGRILALAYLAAPALAQAWGYLPGRRLGFGGNEARSLIVDWARTGRTGRYAAAGMSEDLEQRLAELSIPVLAIRLRDDWMVPPASLQWLLQKMPRSPSTVIEMAPQDMRGGLAGHFDWMREPVPVATRLAAWIDAQPRIGA